MPILRKKIGKVSSINKTGKQTAPVMIRKAETVTLPADLNMMYIYGSAPDAPTEAYRVDFIRQSEHIWSRGHGDTIAQALRDAKPIGKKQRPRETPRNTVASAYNTSTATESGNDHGDTKEKAKTKSGIARKLIRKPA